MELTLEYCEKMHLFDWKAGNLVPRYDLTGKDLPKLIKYINYFDKATKMTVKTEKVDPKFYLFFSELENFARFYPNFLCGSLPKKEGQVLAYFYSLDYKDAIKKEAERIKNNVWRY